MFKTSEVIPVQLVKDRRASGLNGRVIEPESGGSILKIGINEERLV